MGPANFNAYLHDITDFDSLQTDYSCQSSFIRNEEFSINTTERTEDKPKDEGCRNSVFVS